MIVTADEDLAVEIRHLIRQRKGEHSYLYIHDGVGYNYELPNINAALACAQLSRIEEFMESKRQIRQYYEVVFGELGIKILAPPGNTSPNYWLNAIAFDNRSERDGFLKLASEQGVQVREPWMLLDEGSPFGHCIQDGLDVSRKLHRTIALIPSGLPTRSSRNNLS